MIAALLATALVLAPTALDLPPEGVYAPATAELPAVRIDPPTAIEVAKPEPPTFADDCAEMAWYRAKVGLPPVFDKLGWRESNCRNEDKVHTSCCHGWWQLNIGVFLRDARMRGRLADCGVTSAADVNSDNPADKMRQACTARALYDLEGLTPWRT